MSHGAGDACWFSGGIVMSIIGLRLLPITDAYAVPQLVGSRLQHVHEAMHVRQRAEVPDEAGPFQSPEMPLVFAF